MNWKGFVLTHGVNHALPILLGLLPLYLAGPGIPRGWSRARVHAVALALFLATRVGLGLLMYPVALTHPAGDLAYHAERAVLVLEGGIPGRDFENPHGLLFPYWNAAFALLSGDRPGFGILLGFLAADAVVCVLAALYFRNLLPERESLLALACLAASPLLWAQEVFRGQDESVFLACLTASAWLQARGRHASSAALAGLGVVLAKVTVFPYALALVLVSALRSGPSWWRPVLAGALPGALAAALLVALGGDPLDVLRYQGEKLDVWGFNLSTVLRAFGGDAGRILSIVVYGLATAGVAAAAAWRSRTRPAAESSCSALVLVHGTVIITMPFLVLDYPTQGLTFLCALAFAGGTRTSTWILAGALAAMGTLVGLTRSLPDGTVFAVTIPVILAAHLPFLVVGWRRLAGDGLPAPARTAA